MKSNYSFLNESLNLQSIKDKFNDYTYKKTVWSRRKQYKLLQLILKECPTAKDFNIKFKNTYVGINCDPNFDRETYIKYLKENVIKYTKTAKIIIAILLTLCKSVTYALILQKLAYDIAPKKDPNVDYIKNLDKFNDLKNTRKMYGRSGYCVGFGVGAGSGYGAYKLLDLIDKEKQL